MKPVLCSLIMVASLAAAANAQQPAQKAAQAKVRDAKERVARRTLALIAIQEAVAAGKATLGKLHDLQKDAENFNFRFDELLTNDDGRRIAKDWAVLLAFQVRVYKPGRFPLDEARTRSAAVKALVENLEKDLRELADTYVPDKAFGDILKQHDEWATRQLGALADRSTALTACIDASPEVGEGEAVPTLDEALKKPASDELREFADIYEEVLRGLEPERQRRIRETAEEAETGRMKQDIDALRQQLQTELDAQRHQHELELARLQQERDELRRELEQFGLQQSKMEAAHERDIAKQKLIERCKDAEVQRVLAPLLAEGYWQPGGRTTTKGGMSLKRLQAAGALTAGDRGIVILVKTICDPANDRPNWGLRIANEQVKRSLERMTPEQIETAKKVQAYLNQLGPTMVELGMLTE